MIVEMMHFWCNRRPTDDDVSQVEMLVAEKMRPAVIEYWSERGALCKMVIGPANPAFKRQRGSGGEA